MWNKSILIIVGSALGAGIFLLCAAMWVGSPIQDLVVSTAGRLIDHPTHELTASQVEALTELIKHHAVMPADQILSHIVSFYTTLINLLVGLLTALGIIAYMYIRSSSDEQAHKQTTRYLGSDEFKGLVGKEVKIEFTKSVHMEVGDITDGE